MLPIFTIPKFPTATFREEEMKKALPPIEGREILTTEQQFLGEDGKHQKGYHQRYSRTLPELTLLMERLTNNYQAEKAILHQMQDNLRFYTNLPARVEAFLKDITRQLEEYRTEQTAALEHVSQVLDELLEGKAKPSGDMMQIILDAIHGQKSRI